MEVYVINSIAKSYNLNIKIRPLVTDYELRIKLVSRLAKSCNLNIKIRPLVTEYGHLWSYFDIQNLRIAMLKYIIVLA